MCIACVCGYEPLTMGRRVKTEKKRSVVREGEIKKNENRKKFRSTLYLYIIIIITHIVYVIRAYTQSVHLVENTWTSVISTLVSPSAPPPPVPQRKYIYTVLYLPSGYLCFLIYMKIQVNPFFPLFFYFFHPICYSFAGCSFSMI